MLVAAELGLRAEELEEELELQEIEDLQDKTLTHLQSEDTDEEVEGEGEAGATTVR
jgi:hypothetical protein|eukprot:COSAG01_NODE_13109_length_1634_cov_1.161564_2_plen_56_part_00